MEITEDAMKRQPLKHYDPPRLVLIASLGLTFAPMQSGCGEAPADTGRPVCVDEPGPEPEVDVSRTWIDFGEEDPEYQHEISEEVSICNLGTRDDLHIQDIALRDEDPAFTISSISSVLAAPGECVTFEIIFDPQAGVVSEDRVIIECDDEDCDGCPKEIGLKGEGVTE
jgi:hypothetical protein